MASMSDILSHIDEVFETMPEVMTDEQEADFEAYLADLAQAESDKVDSFVWAIKEMEARAEFLDGEGDLLKAKAKALKANARRAKDHYCDVLNKHGIRQLAGAKSKVYVQSSTSVDITGIDLIPAEYIRTKVTCEPIKDAIKAVIKAGGEVPGACLITKDGLRIR